MVVVAMLVAGLVTWIVLHARDSGSAGQARGDYASVVDLPHDQPTAQPTAQSTAEGAR